MIAKTKRRRTARDLVEVEVEVESGSGGATSNVLRFDKHRQIDHSVAFLRPKPVTIGV